MLFNDLPKRWGVYEIVSPPLTRLAAEERHLCTEWYSDKTVRSCAFKFAVAALLTLCVGVNVLEASGRWDRTFRDANDEAGVVAVVLCVGIAVVTAGAMLARFRGSATSSQWTPVVPATWTAASANADHLTLPARAPTVFVLLRI